MILFFAFSDDDLARIRSRDPEMFERIFKEHSNKIYNFLMIKTNGNEALADELCSDIFHSALISASSIKDPEKIFSWLMKIAKRRHIDHLRKVYKTKDYEVDEEPDDNIAQNNRDIKTEKAMFLDIALKNIDKEYSELLKLKYVEDKTQTEIAEIVGKSESSVQSLLFRARKALKKEMNRLIKDK